MSLWPSTRTVERIKRKTRPGKLTLAPAPKKAVKKLIKKYVNNQLEKKYVVKDQTSSAMVTGFNVVGTSLISAFGLNNTSWVAGYDVATDNHALQGVVARLDQLDLCYSIHIDPTLPAAAGQAVRIMVVYDNEPSTDTSFNSTLQLYSITANYDDCILRTAEISSPYYATPLGHKGKERFTVIYDKVHNMSTNNPHITVRKRVNLKNKRLKFSGTTLNVLYPLEQNLLLFDTFSGTNTELAPSLSYNTRIWFTDA